jgi:hypothetical protein
VLARARPGGHNAAVIFRCNVRALAMVIALAGASALAAACTSTQVPGPAVSSTAGTAAPGAGPTSSAPPAPSSSYASIADLAKALNDKGITCALSYPGIKDDVSQAELSICTIDNEQAYLRVWQGPELVTKFLAGPDGQTGTVAVGANWTISFGTPATASKVAAALGGTAPGAKP